jgi:O-antigen ligase
MQRNARILTYSTKWKSIPQSWFWLLCTDLYPVLAAFALPWSTTAVSVFLGIWIFVLLPTINMRALLASLRRPESFIPVVFFSIAVLGMLWASSPWEVRTLGLHPVAKMLAIPLLLYHFGRSQRSLWVFVAFFSSCALLMIYSWAIYLEPSFSFMPTGTAAGVPVRNYIDQSHEFTLCLFAATPILLRLISEKRWKAALCCASLLLGFYCNLMFVVSARTAFLYFPVLLVMFGFRFCRPKLVLFFALAAVLQGSVWLTSPYVRNRMDQTVSDYEVSRNDSKLATSDGLRMAYWRASVRSIATAPIFGHGTGSTKEVFDQEAAGKTGVWANSIRNPHNQTLYVAIQWGVFGCIVLYAMWFSHLSLFLGRGFASWVGLVLVVQNFIGSLVNSHLFDFHEGWIYVLGVGVAGGMLNAGRTSPASIQR